MATLTIQPPVLDLSIYAGDGISFQLICKDETGAPIDLIGTIEAQIRVNRNVDSSPIVEFSAHIADSTTGIVALSLTGQQTQELVTDPSSKDGKFIGVWDVEWTPTNLEARTLCQGKVECMADVTR